MNKFALFILIGTLILSACGLFPWRNTSPMYPGGDRWGGGSYTSNGEGIYFTATNDRGERIPYAGGPAFGGMMGASLTCAACHGSDARGGFHTMHMQAMDAPDIRYAALKGEAGEHGREQGDDHDGEPSGELNDEHGDYTLENFRQAVVLGQHPDEDTLSRDMPRWQMSDDDLADLFEFIQSHP